MSFSWSEESMLAPAPWTRDAACLDVDPDMFFPTNEQASVEAKKVCAKCPVREDCLEDSLRNRDTAGIFGGKTTNERRDLAKQLGIPGPPKVGRRR